MFLLLSRGLRLRCLMFCANTLDFTKRVKAVSSGMLCYGKPLESPVAGRSSRQFCWLAGLGNWLLFIIICSKGMPPSFYPQVFQICFPKFTGLAVIIAVAAVILAKTGSWSAWLMDWLLAYVSVAPIALLQINAWPCFVQFAEAVRREELHPAWYDQVISCLSICWMMIVAETQVLIQAGCHPYICILVVLLLMCHSFLLASFSVMRGNLEPLLEDGAPIGSWSLTLAFLLSHYLDYFARMRAIEQGMQQENASSADCMKSNLNLSRNADLEVELAEALRPASS